MGTTIDQQEIQWQWSLMPLPHNSSDCQAFHPLHGDSEFIESVLYSRVILKAQAKVMERNAICPVQQRKRRGANKVKE